MPEASSKDIAKQRLLLMEALRAYGLNFNEFSHRFADWLDMHSTDATALLEISSAEQRGQPLSPARLAERISLSSGATTALLNRLEQAGHIERTREHADRRVVTVRATEHVGALAEEFFGPLAARMDVALAKYPLDVLAQFEALLGDLRATMDDYLNEPGP